MILERHMQTLAKGIKVEQYIEWEKGFDGIEKRISGYCPKKHLWLMAGGDDMGTIIWEREWESLAAMEAFYEKTSADPAQKKLIDKWGDIIASEKQEFYGVVPYKDIYGEQEV